MAGGWSDDGAVNKQIDATIEDAVARARDHLGHGESAEFCDECGEPIPEARRQALAGITEHHANNETMGLCTFVGFTLTRV